MPFCCLLLQSNRGLFARAAGSFPSVGGGASTGLGHVHMGKARPCPQHSFRGMRAGILSQATFSLLMSTLSTPIFMHLDALQEAKAMDASCQ